MGSVLAGANKELLGANKELLGANKELLGANKELLGGVNRELLQNSAAGMNIRKPSQVGAAQLP